jgi:hypothetical protein
MVVRWPKETMNISRRYLTFSLRTLFVLLTIGCIWLGILAERAREQREAVKAIEALGGHVIYDWSIVEWHDGGNYTMDIARKPPAPVWLRRVIGDDFFQNASQVSFGSPINPIKIELSKAIPCLKKLRTLKQVRFFAVGDFDFDRQKDLKAALPRCDFELYYLDNSRYSMPVRMR